MKRISTLLVLFASPAAAEVVICQSALESPSCYASNLREQSRHLAPEASWEEFTTLIADSGGHPMAEVFWTIGPSVPGATGANAAILTDAFAVNVTKAVCSYQATMGIAAGPERRFVMAGGVISYRLSVFGKSEATVIIDHCEVS